MNVSEVDDSWVPADDRLGNGVKTEAVERDGQWASGFTFGLTQNMLLLQRTWQSRIHRWRSIKLTAGVEHALKTHHRSDLRSTGFLMSGDLHCDGK